MPQNTPPGGSPVQNVVHTEAHRQEDVYRAARLKRQRLFQERRAQANNGQGDPRDNTARRLFT